MYIPVIPETEIRFNESLIFPERQYLEPQKSYLKVETYKDYESLIEEGIMFNFERVVLPIKYRDRKIISIQGVGNLFFSTSLIEKLNLECITSFVIPNRQVELVFV